MPVSTTMPRLMPGETIEWIERPDEAQLRPLPPEWLVAMVNEGRKELGKGKKYAYFMQIPGAQLLAQFTQGSHMPEAAPDNAELVSLVERRFSGGQSMEELARQEGIGYQKMKRWMKLAEQRGLIDAHQRRVTTELGPKAIDALQDALAPAQDIRTRVKAAIAIQQSLEKMDTYVAKREERLEREEKEDTLDMVIAKLRRERQREKAQAQAVAYVDGQIGQINDVESAIEVASEEDEGGGISDSARGNIGSQSGQPTGHDDTAAGAEIVAENGGTAGSRWIPPLRSTESLETDRHTDVADGESGGKEGPN